MELQFENLKKSKPINYLKREHIVLTKELKEKVEKKVLEVLKRAKAIWGVDIPMPTMHFDLKRGTCGMYKHSSQMPGTEYHGKVPKVNILRWHPIFLVENESDYIEETVPHEVAHMIVAWIWKGIPKNKQQKKLMPHGDEWREVMIKLGRGPNGPKTWNKIVKHYYNPSSLDIPPKKKYGPRKMGGKNVGNIMALIGKLGPDELSALIIRLGLEGLAKNPPEVQAEVDALTEHLYNTREYLPLRKGTYSSAGWALKVINTLEAK